MFEHLDHGARRSVVLAQEAARTLGHVGVGTEHLLLGMLQAGDGAAAQALAGEGVTLVEARQDVEETAGQVPHPPDGHISLSPEVKKVLELARRMALELGDDRTGSGHILLVVIREHEGAAAQVLIRLGADLSRIRQEVIKLHASPAVTVHRRDSTHPRLPGLT